MSAQVHENVYDAGGNPGDRLAVAPDPVEVRRNAGLMAAIGAVASGVAIAYLGRAADTGEVLDWVLMGVMALLGAWHLALFVDSRTPLLVADSQGVRLRLGRSWRGLPWGSLRAVEHTPRRGLLRDGRVVLVPHASEKVLSELDGSGRRQARMAERIYGAPFAVPLGLTTRVRGLGDAQDLSQALTALAGSGVQVVTLVPTEDEAPDAETDEPVDPPQARAAEAPEVDTDRAGEEEYGEPGETRGSGRGWRDPRPAVAGAISAASGLFRLPGQRPKPAEEEPDEDLPAAETEASETEVAEPEVAEPEVAEVGETDAPEAEVESELVEDDAAPEPLVWSKTSEREDDAATAFADDDADDDTEPTVEVSPTPPPSRVARLAQRAQLTVRLDRGAPEPDDERPSARELRRRGSEVSLVEDTQAWGERVRPLAKPGSPVAPLVIDEFAAEPAEDPVIGPELRAARTRLGLSVDQLAERTRIRPHVIESMEVDDFQPCGGDFYARGHLRTLARVLGIDVAPLLESFDDRYAHAPISPRTVFEAELATGTHGGIRGTRGGPNWSVLVAAVMAIILAWSIARLAMDGPEEVRQIPSLGGGSGGVSSSAPQSGGTIPVLLRAAGGGASVTVRDGEGEVVFTGDLAYGATRPLDVVPPVRVESSDGGLEVVADGVEKGQLGDPGHPATGTFVAR